MTKKRFGRSIYYYEDEIKKYEKLVNYCFRKKINASDFIKDSTFIRMREIGILKEK